MNPIEEEHDKGYFWIMWAQISSFSSTHVSAFDKIKTKITTNKLKIESISKF